MKSIQGIVNRMRNKTGEKKGKNIFSTVVDHKDREMHNFLLRSFRAMNERDERTDLETINAFESFNSKCNYTLLSHKLTYPNHVQKVDLLCLLSDLKVSLSD